MDSAGCPDEYSPSSEYEPGDRVSVYIEPERAVVWECENYPYQSNQFSPLYEISGSWHKVASCSGSASPTSSPNFVRMEIGDGCPNVYDSATRYEPGDLVAVIVSTNPLRQMVFGCKNQYCNAGPAFSPGSEDSDLGWTLKGHCSGSISPTASPTEWSRVCHYNNGTHVIDIQSWSENDLSTYASGTRVRKGTQIFRCKNYPKNLWCRMLTYEPLISSIWEDAWQEFGTC